MWEVRGAKREELNDKFDLVWLYDISTIVGYLMPNPFYTYIYIY